MALFGSTFAKENEGSHAPYPSYMKDMERSGLDFMFNPFYHEIPTYPVPWQVSMMHPEIGHMCSGTIIDENTIITVAHCFIPLAPWFVVAGINSFLDFKNEQIVFIDNHTIHPKYNDTRDPYDIVLVKLSQPLNFTDDIQPIQLHSSETYIDLTECFVTGWTKKYKWRLREKNV